MTHINNEMIKENFVKYCGRHKWTENSEQLLAMAEQLKNTTYKVHNDILKLVPDKNSFQDIVLPQAIDSINYLDMSSYLEFFQYVSTDEDQRTASTTIEKELSDFQVKLGMSKPMFEKLSECQAANIDLEGEEKRLLDRWILDGKRNGLHLDKSTREEIESLMKELNNLCITFNNNINNENTILWFSDEELMGIPQDLLESLEVGDNKKRKITLKYPHVIPTMKYCQIESTRKIVNFHFNSRCIKENIPIFERIIELRHQRARLLGYSTHAQYTIEKLMAKNPKNVNNFLDSLVEKLRPLQNKELQRFLQVKKDDCIARNMPFDGLINSWDYSFYSNIVEKLDYHIDHDKLKEYFDFNDVCSKILTLYQNILKLCYVKVDDISTWHPDVSLYAVIEDNENSNNKGEILGYFYLDLFPRPNKYNHAACFTIQHRCQLSDSKHQPGVSAMVANFTKPIGSKPCLFTHNEVETFFHEFGHVMHSLCSLNRFVEFSGTNVERDFVEAPSQMLENWVWDKRILKLLSKHYTSHEPMPDELITILVNSKNANAAHFYLRQISFAKLDQSIHTKEHIDSAKEVYNALTTYWGITPMEGTNFISSFGHLTGGYDARYYGYLWSEVYSSDMYESRFKNDPMNSEVGFCYRKSILSPGGSKDGMDMLHDFLGREPSENSFIKSIGL